MTCEEENILGYLNQILKYINEGKMDFAKDLFDKAEQLIVKQASGNEIINNLTKFIKQHFNGAIFLNAIANGNLDVNPPDDPLHQNFVISQYKQLHSNLRHLTWQTQQIAKGDLKQKVSFLGDFSVAFNKMIESLREKQLFEEKIRIQNEQLQKLNATKDKFFTIIAHDLKSPFNSIVGFSELLVEKVKKNDYTGIGKYAGIVLQSSERALELLMNLMEWSRSQTGKLEFNPEYFEIVKLIDDIADLFRDIAGEKAIVITLNLPSINPVFADKAMINTVLRNLISNAIKFTRPGGKIKISAHEKPGELTVSVADNGVGISKSNTHKLFMIEENNTTPGTNNEKGTGLGLILCKEFVEKHSGRIWVESQEDKGSVFTFSLPLKN